MLWWLVLLIIEEGGKLWGRGADYSYNSLCFYSSIKFCASSVRWQRRRQCPGPLVAGTYLLTECLEESRVQRKGKDFKFRSEKWLL